MENPPVNTPNTISPIRTTYTNGTNTISTTTTYAILKTLLAYPPCPHRNPPESRWPCPPCESSFTTSFWTATATLLDYFADFFPHDTPPMQSLWFHYLDMWQSAVLWLEYTHAISEGFNTPQTPRHARQVLRAKRFKRDFELARKLFETVIYGPRKMARDSVKLSEDVIHKPHGKINGPPVNHETGPWISGLKPWQQWLGAGSPGVAALLPADRKQGDGIRHVPMSGLAIVEKHTRRARGWAIRLASRDPDTATEEMARFDAHCLRFPRMGKSSGYVSLHGQSVRYTLVNGAPPVSRVPGLCDEDMKIDYPVLSLVDECVGICKGEGAYEAQSGVPGEKEGGDDGDEEVEEEEEEKQEEEEVEEDSMDGWFDLWTVVESGEVVEDKGKFAEGMKDLFDEWCWGERAQRVDREMSWQ